MQKTFTRSILEKILHKQKLKKAPYGQENLKTKSAFSGFKSKVMSRKRSPKLTQGSGIYCKKVQNILPIL